MVQFDKLRLSGFKSFVDPTELVIEPGMTGIVGPNGCGKSNLVEAHEAGSWARIPFKNMRASEHGRRDLLRIRQPPRPQHRRGGADTSTIPDAHLPRRMFNDNDTTRGRPGASSARHGSVYSDQRQARCAPATCRSLFADASTGSRSHGACPPGPAFPQTHQRQTAGDRRGVILEEAAGIAGLSFARRHEAETAAASAAEHQSGARWRTCSSPRIEQHNWRA